MNMEKYDIQVLKLCYRVMQLYSKKSQRWGVDSIYGKLT